MENNDQHPVRVLDFAAKPPSLPGAVPASGVPEPDVMEITSGPQPEIPGIVKFKLFKPYKVDGQEVTELVLDFDRLDGDTLENIDEQLRADGKAVPRSAVWSETYCMYIGARAAGMHVKNLRRMGFKDTVRVVKEVQDFLLNTEA